MSANIRVSTSELDLMAVELQLKRHRNDAQHELRGYVRALYFNPNPLDPFQLHRNVNVPDDLVEAFTRVLTRIQQEQAAST